MTAGTPSTAGRGAAADRPGHARTATAASRTPGHATLWVAQYRCLTQRRVIWVIGGWCVVAALLAAVATAGPVHLWHAPPPSKSPDETSITPAASPPVVTVAPLSPEGGGHAADWVGIVLEIIAAAVILGAVIAGVLAVRRRRPRITWRRRQRIRPQSVLPDVETTIAEDAPVQRDLLRHGDVRNAIVACWLRLEAAVEAAGVARRASDTSTDLVTRVLGEHAVDAPALRTLAALFREARFSSHTMGEGQREAALDALDRIHASLGGRLEPVGRPG